MATVGVKGLTNLVFQLDVLFGNVDHVAAGHATGQSVVAVDVLLELGGTADQQATTTELEQLTPDQRRRYRPSQIPLPRVAFSAQLLDETLRNQIK